MHKRLGIVAIVVIAAAVTTLLLSLDRLRGNVPIRFYGRVVDERGVGVGGAQVFGNVGAERALHVLTVDNPRQREEVVMVFEVATGKELFRREGARPQVASLIGDAIAPDGSRVLVSEIDARLKRRMIVLDVDGGREVWSAERAVAGDVTFLNDPNLVLSGELHGPPTRRLSLHDVRAAEPLWSVELANGAAPVFTAPPPDDRHLLCLHTGIVEDMYFVFDMKTKSVLPNLAGSKRLVMPYLRLTDGRPEVLGFLDGKLARWNAATGKRAETGPIPDWRGTDRSAFSPDGSRLYVPHRNSITVRNTADGEVLRTVQFTLPPVMVAVGPGDLMVLRTIPGQFRIVRLNDESRRGGGSAQQTKPSQAG